MSRLTLFHFTCFYSLLQWNWKMPTIKTMQIFRYFPTNEKCCQIWIFWFCFVSIFRVHFGHKSAKIQFWKSLKYFKFFFIKKTWCQIWICPVEQCLILFYCEIIILKDIGICPVSVWFGLSFIVCTQFWR